MCSASSSKTYPVLCTSWSPTPMGSWIWSREIMSSSRQKRAADFSLIKVNGPAWSEAIRSRLTSLVGSYNFFLLQTKMEEWRWKLRTGHRMTRGEWCRVDSSIPSSAGPRQMIPFFLRPFGQMKGSDSSPGNRGKARNEIIAHDSKSETPSCYSILNGSNGISSLPFVHLVTSNFQFVLFFDT